MRAQGLVLGGRVGDVDDAVDVVVGELGGSGGDGETCAMPAASSADLSCRADRARYTPGRTSAGSSPLLFLADGSGGGGGARKGEEKNENVKTSVGVWTLRSGTHAGVLFVPARRQKTSSTVRGPRPRPVARWRDGGHVVAGRAVMRAGAFEGRVPVRRTLTRLGSCARDRCARRPSPATPRASPRPPLAAARRLRRKVSRGEESRAVASRPRPPWAKQASRGARDAADPLATRRTRAPRPVPPRRARDGARGASGIEPARDPRPD